MASAALQLAARLTTTEAISSLRDAAERALAGDPRNAALLWKLGQLNRALGDIGAAARAYAACGEAAPDHPMAAHLDRLMRGDPQFIEFSPETMRPAPFLRLTDFLPPAVLGALWDAVEQRKERFQPAGLLRNEGVVIDTATRHTLCFRANEAVRSVLHPQVVAAINDHALPERFGLSHPVSHTDVEMSVTSHLNGGFYHAHRDDSHGTLRRVLTCVFYFFQEPQAFTGGDLLLFDETADRRRLDPLAFTRFVPAANSAVFFPSDRLHEVRPVSTGVTDPLASRLTVNLWFRRAD